MRSGIAETEVMKRLLLPSAMPLILAASCSVAGAQAAPFKTRLQEDLRITSSESASGMLLTTVSSMTVMPDGRILTAHRTENTIRVFGADGKLIRTLGRKGSGPGEFQSLSQIGHFGDTLFACDATRYRYVIFSPTYSPITEVATPRTKNGGGRRCRMV